MGEYKDPFVEDFFRRTLQNLQLYHDCMDQEEAEKKPEDQKQYIYETTQLINSFLGLIVFVKEENCLTQHRRLDAFVNQHMATTWTYKKENGQDEPHDFKYYLRHIRNAISHKRITAESDANQEIEKITFKDHDRRNRRMRFQLTLSVTAIKELIGLISDAMGIQTA